MNKAFSNKIVNFKVIIQTITDMSEEKNPKHEYMLRLGDSFWTEMLVFGT